MPIIDVARACRLKYTVQLYWGINRMVVPPLYRKTQIPLVFLSQCEQRLVLFETRFRLFRFSNFHVSFLCVVRRFQFVGLEALKFEVTHLVLATSWLSHRGCRGCHIKVVIEPSCDVGILLVGL